MSDTRIIRVKLRRMLPSLDLETATQRTIIQQLEDELGISLDGYKDLVRKEVDAFLVGDDPDAESDTSKEEKEPPAKKPRAEPAARPGTPTAAGTSTNPGDFLYSVPISSARYAGVRTFKGRGIVDVREFYTNKDTGALAPGNKGLSMSPEQWYRLTEGMVAINEALGRADEEFFIDLGSNRRASVSLHGGKTMVSLREHYEKDGRMLPGKKGISLPPDQWTKLCAAYEDLSERLAALPGGAGVPAAPAAPKAEPAAAGDAGGGDAPKGSAGAILSIELAPLRRAEVTKWKGRGVVDVREFYLKDGALAHTKKGMQMDPAQFKALRDAAAGLDGALAAKDKTFAVDLAPKRRATVSEFKGRYSVDIREWYEKDGKLAPTQKGLSLPPEQWGRLRDALPQLAETLEQA